MARSISLTLLAEMFKEQTDYALIALLEISHPTFAETIYLSSDPTERVSTDPLYYRTIHDTQEYIFAPFKITLPDDREDMAPTCNFVVENVSREIIARVRSIDPRQGQPTLDLKLITSADLDFVEIEYPQFDIVSFQYNADAITFTAQINALVEEPYPGSTMDPSGFPAIHGTPT